MQENFDYIEDELKFVRENFNLEDVLEFEKNHCVEIIRGTDWQYECYIDRKCYYVALTPFYSLLQAIKRYKQDEKK